MNNTKNITKRMIFHQRAVLEIISKAIKDNIMTTALIMGLIGIPMFSALADDNSAFRGNDTIPSSNFKQNNLKYPELSILKTASSPFGAVDHNVIGIDLGKYQVVTATYSKGGIGKIVENSVNHKSVPALIASSEIKHLAKAINRFAICGTCKLKSDAVIAQLVKKYKKAGYKNVKSIFKPVPGYEEYLDQIEFTYDTETKKVNQTAIIPIQDMTTPINPNNLTEYNKKQIFGIGLQARQYFIGEVINNQYICNIDKRPIDLNLTFNDQVPEKNKEIIAAIYAEVYAEEFKVDLSKINVSYVNESDAAITTYLYENYNATLKQSKNHDKIVVLNLGQDGLTMKGLMGTDQEIQITKSKAYQNISGDLIDEAIWNVFKEKVAQEIGKSKDIDLTYEKAKNLVETNLSLKSKCLVEQKNAKEKLSADGASSVIVSIGNVYKDKDVDFVFSVEDINAALNEANLIETFKNDIKDGVKEMYGADNTKGIKFAIVGGSLRIDYLKKVVAELVTGKEIKDKAMISANLIQTLNMDESQAYGAAYTSLLKNEYKNVLSKTITAKQVEQTLGSIKFNNCKLTLDKLFTLCAKQTKLEEDRNAIEKACYSVDDIIKVIKASDLSKIKNEINQAQINLINTKQKEANEKRLRQLQQIVDWVKNRKQWDSLKVSSDRIFSTILRNKDLLTIDNLEFITSLSNCFNDTTIEVCKRQPDQILKLVKNVNTLIANPQKNRGHKEIKHQEELLESLRSNLTIFQMDNTVFSKAAIEILSKNMDNALRKFNNNDNQAEALVFVNKVFPFLNELTQILINMNFDKTRLEDEDQIKMLLHGLKFAINHALTTYSASDGGFSTIKKNFVRNLILTFQSIDSDPSSSSKLLKNTEFKRKLNDIKNRIANTFDINYLKNTNH